MSFSERLKFCLAEAGIDGAELARRIGVSRTSVKYWVDGTTVHPRPEHLFPASRELGVSAEWLGTGKGEKLQVTPLTGDMQAGGGELTAYQQVLVREIGRLMPHEIAALLEIIKSLNEKGSTNNSANR